METVIMYQHSSALFEGKWANWCVFDICLLSPWERCPVSSRLGWFYRSDLPASPCRSASLKALHGRIRNGSNLSRREYCNQTEPNWLNLRWNRFKSNATIYIYALFCVPCRDKYTYIMRYAYLLKRCRSVWKLLDSEVYFTFHPDGVGVVWRTFGAVSKRMQLRNTIFCILLMVTQVMSCSWHRRNEVHSFYSFFDFRFIEFHWHSFWFTSSEPAKKVESDDILPIYLAHVDVVSTSTNSPVSVAQVWSPWDLVCWLTSWKWHSLKKNSRLNHTARQSFLETWQFKKNNKRQ